MGRKAGAKKASAAAKKKGIGIFAPVKLSSWLAAICGGGKMTRPEAIKKLWVYIKAKKLNEGRIIKPDDKLKAVLPVAKVDMLKMAGMVSKHMSKWDLGRAPGIQEKSSDVAPGSHVAGSKAALAYA